MSQHGLFLNFKPGKTAAIVALRGRGSRALNRKFFTTGSPTIPCTLDGEDTLTVGHTYKHMGSLTTATGDCQLEVKERISPQAAPYGVLRRKVLPNPAIQARVSVSLTDSLLDARLLCNAHT
eukprot:7809128-Alexandrium_andersonii.AAC.1